MSENQSEQGKVGDETWRKYAKVVRHKDFAKRIEIACENHPLSPSGHGRQVWLKNTLAEKFSERVSTEAVRKWFAGEARPKPKMMSFIARALGVDEAWLSLGITPSATPVEKQKQNALAAGAVNLVAGHIQLAGSSIAFPEAGQSHDISAIIRGKIHNITVRLFSAIIHVPQDSKDVVVVHPTDLPTVFTFFKIHAEMIADTGSIRGDYIELNCAMVGNKLVVSDRAATEINDFAKL